MIKIAICDDDKLTCDMLEKKLYSYEEKLDEEIDISCFDYSVEFYRKMKSTVGKNPFDIIFLDIEMPELDGIDIGQKIREEFEDEITQIIYISSKSAYAMQLFQIRPLDFLIKPLTDKNIEKVLTNALRLINLGNYMFKFIKNGEIYREPINQILYFQSMARKIIIHTTHGEIAFYDKLSHVLEQLGNRRFISIHKSYVINYDHVSILSYDHVILSNKEQLSISLANRKLVREKFLEYEGNE